MVADACSSSSSEQESDSNETFGLSSSHEFFRSSSDSSEDDSRTIMQCGPSVYGIIYFWNGCCSWLNENNSNPTCSLLGS